MTKRGFGAIGSPGLLYKRWYGLREWCAGSRIVVPAADPAQRAAERRQALGAHVRQLRTGLGWTQEELAHQTGFDRKSVNRVENGAYSPSLDRIAVLADALGVPVSELVAPLD